MSIKAHVYTCTCILYLHVHVNPIYKCTCIYCIPVTLFLYCTYMYVYMCEPVQFTRSHVAMVITAGTDTNLVLLVSSLGWSEGGTLIFPRGAGGLSWWWISILSSSPPPLELGTRGSKFISLTSTGGCCEWVESDVGGVACEKSTSCVKK